MIKRATLHSHIGATLAATMVVLVTGCQGKGRQETAAGTPESPTEAPASVQPDNTAQDNKSRGAPAREDPFAAAIASHLSSIPDPEIVAPTAPASTGDLENRQFRDAVIGFVRQVSAGGPQVNCNLSMPAQAPVDAVVRIYLQGAEVGRGTASDTGLCPTLKLATRRALAAAYDVRASLAKARFSVHLPAYKYSMVEFAGKGVELDHGLVPVRALDKAFLQKRIELGKAYLLRVIDDKHKGVHKYYRAPLDAFENTLHTIYTASTIYTLLKLYAYDHDKRLLASSKDAAEFLLSMQVVDKRERSYGGFYYSFDLNRQRPHPKLVVGTTSKSIFTLIMLHELTKDKKYMDAARRAADWLMTMQRPSGKVGSYLRRSQEGKWMVAKKESMLYTGQTLSALSRMYAATGDRKYLDAASLTANYLASKVARKGCYLGDQYRKPNPISSSWVILSLFDFAKSSKEKRYMDMVFGCADELLTRQIDDADDVYRYGRWQRSLSSSGNGWLAEVMSELYMYCHDQGMEGCDRFKDAIVKVIRILMQYTYSPENAFVVKNPDKAIGGVFWNVRERYVRTDSVCHAMNAYVHIIKYLGEGVLVEVPEPPLAERLSRVHTPPPQ